MHTNVIYFNNCRQTNDFTTSNTTNRVLYITIQDKSTILFIIYLCHTRNTKWQFTKLLNTIFHCYFIFKYPCFVLSLSDFLWLWLVASLYYPCIWYVLGEKKSFMFCWDWNIKAFDLDDILSNCNEK